MKPAAHDSCLLSKVVDNVLIGNNGFATDDSTNTGNHLYEIEGKKSMPSLITKRTAKFPFRFLGTLNDRHVKSISSRQDLHIKKLSVVNTESVDTQNL